MATGAYIGSSNSKKLKALYVGIGNISKKIKKAYVGVNNQARVWWKTANIPPINNGSIYSISGSPSHASVIDAKTSAYGISRQYDIFDEGASILVFVNSSGVTTQIRRIDGNVYYDSQSGSTLNHIFVYSSDGVSMYNNNLVATPVSNKSWLKHAAVASFSSRVFFLGGTSSRPTEDAHIYDDSGVYRHIENFEYSLGLAKGGGNIGIYKHIIKFKDRFIFYGNYTLTQSTIEWRMVTENIVLVATGMNFEPYGTTGVVNCIDDGSVAYCMGGIGYDQFNPGQMIAARPTGVINDTTLYTSQFPGYIDSLANMYFSDPIAVGDNTYSPLFMASHSSGQSVGAIIDRNGTFIYIGSLNFGSSNEMSYLRLSQNTVYVGMYYSIIKVDF